MSSALSPLKPMLSLSRDTIPLQSTWDTLMRGVARCSVSASGFRLDIGRRMIVTGTDAEFASSEETTGSAFGMTAGPEESDSMTTVLTTGTPDIGACGTPEVFRPS